MFCMYGNKFNMYNTYMILPILIIEIIYKVIYRVRSCPWPGFIIYIMHFLILILNLSLKFFSNAINNPGI